MTTPALMLGASNAGALTLSLETLIETRLLVTATSGGGKSGAIFQLCELCVPHVQTFILDPEGEFAPLRGQFPFVLVGPEGETPASVKTASLLAHKLLALGASAILDLYELPVGERHAFVAAFLAAMVDAPKTLWHPVVVVVDEAHVFAPERGQGESVASGAMVNMASRGRKRGFCLVVATQRLAMLSKTLAANCQNVLVGRTSQIDQARAAETLHVSDRAGKEALWRELSQMPVGRFYAYGMAFGATEPVEFQVARASTLPLKKSGIALAAPPTPEAIRSLLPQLNELPQEAEKQAKTEDELRRELQEARAHIRRLEKDAGEAKPAGVDAFGLRELTERLVTLTEAFHSVASDASYLNTQWNLGKEHIERIQEQMEPFYALAHPAVDIGYRAVEGSRRLKGELVALDQDVRAIAPLPRGVDKPPPPLPSLPTRTPSDGSAAKIGKALRAIMAVLAQHGPSSIRKIATITTYEATGGGFRNALGEGRSKGWLIGSDPVALTVDGQVALGEVEELPSGLELLKMWAEKLSKAEREIVYVLEESPRAVEIAELAAVTGYVPTGGGFRNALGRLRTLGLIEGKGSLALSAEFRAALNE